MQVRNAPGEARGVLEKLLGGVAGDQENSSIKPRAPPNGYLPIHYYLVSTSKPPHPFTFFQSEELPFLKQQTCIQIKDKWDVGPCP